MAEVKPFPSLHYNLAAVPSLGFARGVAQSSAVYSADGKQLVVACGGFAVLDAQSRQAVTVVQTIPPSGISRSAFARAPRMPHSTTATRGPRGAEDAGMRLDS